MLRVPWGIVSMVAHIMRRDTGYCVRGYDMYWCNSNCGSQAEKQNMVNSITWGNRRKTHTSVVMKQLPFLTPMIFINQYRSRLRVHVLYYTRNTSHCSYVHVHVYTYYLIKYSTELETQKMCTCVWVCQYFTEQHAHIPSPVQLPILR